ncbi:NEQ369 [Nanoarchaeum equitans Kin4-M]|uniref:NEQ369 n=1 Tax=Nanoarchaeum equitans (strain Kin4-M) TaxID=228908 RepID=Q74MC4_NANEQ|nr:NEQ369 [Nanoarchaeum equitans Kin4-M]
MILREYQKKAVSIALEKKKCVIVLPTGTGKTIIGAYFVKNLLDKGKAIIVVPTRILVEQTYNVYKSLGLNPTKIYGIIPKSKRANLWKKAKIAITTPETAYFDKEYIDHDIIVLDECHHAIGNDYYAKLLREKEFEYKLGLSAFIPKKYRKEIESLIGEIIELYDEPSLKKYIPNWIGDIYEAPLNKLEYQLYKEIEELKRKSKGSKRLIYSLALKYLATDGGLALKESVSKNNILSKILSPFKDKIEKIRDLHKWDALKSILDTYEFEKAIIFIDRVIVAKRVAQSLDAALIIGKKHKNIAQSLKEAKEKNIIVATSAGEEGLDLPSADLLIVWSQTSNPIRFIQRHGRIMRPTKMLKFVTYIVTPYTIDVDLFLSAVLKVSKYVDININVKNYFKKSSVHQIINLLTEPLTKDMLKQLGFTDNEINIALKYGIENGDIVYFYSPFGKLYINKDFMYMVERRYPTIFIPKWEGKIKINNKTIKGDYQKLYEKLSNMIPIKGLKITVIKKKDIIEYDWRSYNYTIDSKPLLRLVLRNALS